MCTTCCNIKEIFMLPRNVFWVSCYCQKKAWKILLYVGDSVLWRIPTPYLASRLYVPEGRAGTAQKLSEPLIPSSQCHNVAIFTAQLPLLFIFFLFFFLFLFFFFTSFFYLEKGLDRIFTYILYAYPEIKFYLSVFKGLTIIFTVRGSVFHVK
jgi:hypothetical protein